MSRRTRRTVAASGLLYAAVVVGVGVAVGAVPPPTSRGAAVLFGWQALGALVVGGVAGYFYAADGSRVPGALLALVVAAVLSVPGAGSPDTPAARPGPVVLWAYLIGWPAAAAALAAGFGSEILGNI